MIPVISILLVLGCFFYIFNKAKWGDKKGLTRGEILEAQTDGWILWFWVVVIGFIIFGIWSLI